MFIDDEELRDLYKTSSVEHIQAIESALMQLEKQPQNPTVLKNLLRSAHTLKGDSRMLGVEDVETLVHQIEDCLMPIDKGQASMTVELCDRLYAGLDTIKQLAHTAVTGEPNDVNMFYVLATLMGDAGATPPPTKRSTPASDLDIPTSDLFDSDIFIPTDIQIDKSFDPERSFLDLDEVPSDGWVNPASEEALFDAPSDLWVHTDRSNDLSVSITAEDRAALDPPRSPLQASFLELAAELFPSDSTLPPLTSADDRALIDPPRSPLPNSLLEFASELFPAESTLAPLHPDAVVGEFGSEPFPSDSTLPPLAADAVFGDFTLIPGSSPAADTDGVFLADDDFTLIPSTVEIAPGVGDLDSIDEDRLFDTFDDSLMPISEDLGASLSSIASDLPEITPIAAIPPVVKTPEPPQSRPATPPAAPAATASDRQIDSIRVDAKQLDVLMGQSGEINVINQQIASRLLDLDALMELWENTSRDRQQLQSLIQQLPAQSPLHRHLHRDRQQWEEMGTLIAKFKKSIGADSSRLDLVTSALESGVKKLRLMPLATIFNLFPRMVRDLAKTQSKEINFAIEGGDLLLDKRLLEEIKDPLMHILRNAIDHGIETPAERQLSGKLPAATLMIQVRQTGNQTTIEILDDGRGLDLQRIKATAIKRGLHTQAELDLMSVDRIQSLIFESGFSTRSRVTELSGRGVGLDIVRTNVERIKGSVDVESAPNGGCTFRLVLTHAIGSSQVMMVAVRNQTYAIPVEYVDRMLLVNKAEIFALGGTPTTQINGQTITVAWLADLLALPPIAPNSPGELTRTSNSVACLLLQSGRQQLALLVDRIEDRQLVTIESPHPILKNVPHLSGATILGTGEVCLVLNPLDLFTTAAGGNPLSSKVVVAITSATPTDGPPTILLVEDSLVIRTQMKRILKGAGYEVTVANDGLEGWEKLQAGQFDLVVSDVEMPRWGGLELTTQIRSHAQYQNLPVVLVTTLSRSVDRDRGFEAGANAYLTKGDFDQQLLLDTLTRLI